MEGIEILKKLCKLPGVPGFEQAVRNYLLQELKPYADELSIDPMGNLLACYKGTSNKTLMFSAHMDEIGFIVQHIDDEGFIKFLPLGGFDAKTLTSQRVTIHGKTDVVGVMGSKPIHLMSPEERNQPAKIKDYFIDTGLKKSEVLELIEIGDPITRERELIKMGPCINAKSLDNRISVFVLLEAFKKMKLEKFDCTIYAAFTVQEELGLRGARTVAHKISPDFAINIDTTIAFDVPGAQSHEFVSRLGEGVAIKIMDQSVMCDYRMVKFIKKIAIDQQIKWQNELLPAGGTDTSAIQMAGDGCICGAISIPTRHIHQVNEMVHESDVHATRQLISALAKNIINFEWSHT